MGTVDELRCGWVGDIPDHRDLTFDQPRIAKLLRGLRTAEASQQLPTEVDLRECCPPIANQGKLATSSAHAAVSLVQHLERRASGKLLVPSRLFVDHNAARLSGAHGSCGISLRSALKAMMRFGLPPERYWPYEVQRFRQTPDGFVYGINRALRGCMYVKLDSRRTSGEATLRVVRAYLAAGFSCVCGFPLPGSISTSPDIYFPIGRDDYADGHAVLVVGYADHRWIRSEKGALLIQNSWGPTWGDSGFGWLPYAYVEACLAVDFWTILRRRWLRSGEFSRPLI
jgi:C1A family cysteine protease